MRESADLLILDEPTNDLDIPTLDVLEESLTAFEGGLVLVTHDRLMLDRVATSIVALDGTGGAETFADYAQWEQARTRRHPHVQPPPHPALSPGGRGGEPRGGPARARSRKLGYLEQRELDAMEAAITEAESAAERCRQAAEDPSVASDPSALQERYAALAAARAEVDRLYARWGELEAKGEMR
jgi:ATP-binding cassette subfamily F protein uup